MPYAEVKDEATEQREDAGERGCIYGITHIYMYTYIQLQNESVDWCIYKYIYIVNNTLLSVCLLCGSRPLCGSLPLCVGPPLCGRPLCGSVPCGSLPSCV